MKNYYLKIKVMDPYLKEWDMTEKANTPELAMKHAIAKWRKENWKHRPLVEVTVYCKLIGAIKPSREA